MAQTLISDFDGTLTDLRINWDEFRSKFGLKNVSQVWSLPANKQSEVFSYLSELETNTVVPELLIPWEYFQRFESFSVLTNNSELAVFRFFSELLKIYPTKFMQPRIIVGRESLNGSKEVFETFKNGINMIVGGTQMFDLGEVTYLGDQEYEINFAEYLGMRTIHVSNLRSEPKSLWSKQD